MAEPAKPEVTEEAKMDLLEDDDEFEEFEIDQEWDDKEEGNEALQQWEDDWDDDDVNDDFSLQLRKELESNAPNCPRTSQLMQPCIHRLASVCSLRSGSLWCRSSVQFLTSAIQLFQSVINAPFSSAAAYTLCSIHLLLCFPHDMDRDAHGALANIVHVPA
ncbi:unnamed protein product [Urochloa humidicola]